MSELENFRTYYDLKRFVDKDAFTHSLTYVSWHNRLPMTNLLEIWQAAVVAFVSERMTLTPDNYFDVKDYLTYDGHKPPTTLVECREMAFELASILISKGKKEDRPEG